MLFRSLGGSGNPDDRDAKKEARSRPDLRIGALGTGSDYTTFIDHLGIASLNVAYGGEDDGGIYHSIYDDFYWFTHFSDTDFVYGRALAQTVGTMVLRFADADVLPYEFGDFADTVHRYSEELKTMLKNRQDEVRDRNQALDDGMYNAASDPRRPTVAPQREAIPPFLNFAPLDNGEAAIIRSAEHYSRAMRAFSRNGNAPAPQALQELNTKLLQAERQLTDPDGLPRRPWYKHLVYAPGYYTGYAPKTIPGVREAIEEKRYAEADKEIVRVGKVLQDYAATVEAAATELEKRAR